MSVIGSKDQEGGYTLIELLVVLTILAAVFALLPAFLPSLGRASILQQTAVLVEQDLKKSRLEAMISGKMQTINSGQDSVLHPDRFVNDGLELVSYASSKEERVEFLYFYPNGRSSGANIEIKDERNTILISIDALTGHIRRAP